MVTLLGAGLACHAQQHHTVSFSYDMDGNRITREILFSKMGENGRSMETEDKMLPSATDFFNEIEISLFPNPTSDQFYIEIKGEEPHEQVRALLMHVSGTVIEDRILENALASFDLSRLASGMYILKLDMGDETRVWKVIKK